MLNKYGMQQSNTSNNKQKCPVFLIGNLAEGDKSEDEEDIPSQ